MKEYPYEWYRPDIGHPEHAQLHTFTAWNRFAKEPTLAVVVWDICDDLYKTKDKDVVPSELRIRAVGDTSWTTVLIKPYLDFETSVVEC